MILAGSPNGDDEDTADDDDLPRRNNTPAMPAHPPNLFLNTYTYATYTHTQISSNVIGPEHPLKVATLYGQLSSAAIMTLPSWRSSMFTFRNYSGYFIPGVDFLFLHSARSSFYTFFFFFCVFEVQRGGNP